MLSQTHPSRGLKRGWGRGDTKRTLLAKRGSVKGSGKGRRERKKEREIERKKVILKLVKEGHEERTRNLNTDLGLYMFG